jgi:hypothetical protein
MGTGEVTMEEQYVLDRARLRVLRRQYPAWTQRELAEATGRSLGWVKKWVKRLAAAAPDDDQVLWGHSRARKTAPCRVGASVIERILAIRDDPPDNLRRTPGPRTILYYLHRDEDLTASGVYVPRSTSTIWQILDQHGRIYRPPTPDHVPLERPDPLQDWQMDFKSVSTVPPDPAGKQQHVVETLDVVDAGTSILLAARPRADYNAETTLIALTQIFLTYGLPRSVTFDRDPRFVGSWSGRGFPAALIRFLLCLGVTPHICPAQRPDRNPYVERYHYSYEYECLQVHRPSTLDQTIQVTNDYYWHFNWERPHQGDACHNQPPFVAFPSLPKLPALPPFVDPNRWLLTYHRQTFKRRVRANGTVQIGRQSYYVGRRLKGCYVVLQLDAFDQLFTVLSRGQVVRQLPLKGLHSEIMAFDDYLRMMCDEAVSEWRLWLRHARRKVTM